MNQNGQIVSSDTMNQYDTANLTAPHSRFYYFDGVQVGDVSNNGTSDIDYVASIARNVAKPAGTGLFDNGATSGKSYADFDASYQPINGLDTQGTFSRYTVQDGDTLQSIAQAIWGDANFWYLIADANGLSDSAQLVSGMDLVIPNKVANVSNSSSTFRVYDPNLALGDTSPTHPPKPQNNNNCGTLGMVLLAVVAVAVSVATYGAATAAAASVLGVAEGSTVAAIAGGAVAGVAGSVASQTVGLATGIQSKFNWAAVGEAAIGGAVGGALAPGGLFEGGAFSGVTDSAFIQGALRGATGSLVTQGISVATGLQSKFDWAGVAGAAIGGGVTNAVAANYPITIGGDPVMSAAATTFVSGMAGGLANAATRTLINGSDFGDNLIAALPDIIGQTVGNAFAAEEQVADLAAQSTPQAQAARLAAHALDLNGEPIDPDTLAAATLEFQANAALAQANEADDPIGAAQDQLAAIHDFYAATVTSDAGRAELAAGWSQFGGEPDLIGTKTFNVQDDGVETAIAQGLPLGHALGLLDYPDAWAGVIKQQVGADFNAFVDSVPGGRAALDIIDTGLMFAGGPIRLVSGAAYGLVESHLTNAATNYYQNAGYPDEISSQAGSGLVWLGALALKGISAASIASGIFPVRATNVHHIMTNKNWLSSDRGGPWSPRFNEMAERAGMTLDDAENKVDLIGHVGPHSEEYHQAIFDRLKYATEGLSGDEYTAAFRAQLQAIKTEISTPGTTLNQLLLGE